MVKRLHRFLGKPRAEKILSVRFFLRQGVARIPYIPFPLRFRVSPGEKTTVWWSYVAPYFRQDREFLDYWGEDTGELSFLWRVLRPGMAFLDVGAYHGLYSLLAAKRLRGAGRVVAFEPSPRERHRLRLHRWMNGFDIRVESFAVGSNEGAVKMFIVTCGDPTMNSLRRPSMEGTVQEISVPATCLDIYCRQSGINPIDVIKVDVEGAELEVFDGARQILKDDRPLIICEVLDRVTRPWGYPAREIILYLDRHEYAWFDFRSDGSIVPHARQDFYPEVKNYLAVPMEKLSLVREWASP